MTVQELRDKLGDFDPDAHVMIGAVTRVYEIEGVDITDSVDESDIVVIEKQR